jgi:hypothetical protein
MIDSLPSAKLAVYIFLEMIALGFALEAVAALMRGDHWLKWASALVLGMLFMILGVKSEQILGKFEHLLNWSLWGRRITIAARVLLMLSILAFISAAYYPIRRIFKTVNYLETTTSEDRAKSQNTSPTPNGVNSRTQNAPVPPRRNTHKKPSEAVPRVDWHDKQNWRRFLHTGMTRTEVRQLFGDPEHERVSSDLESWEYGGYGEITFFVDKNSPDGGLYSWTEPK